MSGIAQPHRSALAPRLLALLCVFLVSSCGAPESGSGLAARSAIGPAALAEVQAKFSKAVRHEMALHNVDALSAALIANGETVWAQGFGTVDAEKKIPATADTIYRVGSISSLLTGIAVMQLTGEGKLDLDAPVSTYLPEFRPRNPFATAITIRHLLAHRSGLVREPPVGNRFDDSGPSLADTVASINRTSLVFEPGTTLKYSNAGVAVLGALVEKGSGKPFEDVIRTRIFDPLGMASSAFSPAAALEARAARGVTTSYDDPRTAAPRFELGNGPASNLYSTVEDLAKFITALSAHRDSSAGERFMSAELLERMWTPQGGEGDRRAFGLAFQLEEVSDIRVAGHSGSLHGFAADVRIAPDHGVGIVIAANLDQFPVAKLSVYGMRLLLAARAGKALPDYPTPIAPSAELIRQVKGVYQDKDKQIVLREHGMVEPERRLFVEGGRQIGELRRLGRDWVLEQGDRTVKVAIEDGRLTVAGQIFERIEPQKPAPPADEFAKLVGHYGWPHDYIRVYEWNGRPHVRIEWRHHYQMTPVAKDIYAFPESSLYPYEQLRFTRDESGKGVSVSLNGVVFPRRDFGAEFETFLQRMLRPRESLKTEALAATPPVEEGEYLPSDLVDLQEIDSTIKARLAYATPDNLFGFPTYDEAKAILQRPAAEALGRVSAALRPMGYGLMIHDAYRPWYVTKIFWDAMPDAGKGYVAKPWEGSRHNRGAAVDLTLYLLATGARVEMAAGLDEVSMRSHFAFVGGTDLQRWHRDLLRREMEAQGFTVYPAEWWHFDFKGWRKYRIQNVRFEDMK